jgi:hypothetical protein
MKKFCLVALVAGAVFGAPGCNHGGPGNTLSVSVSAAPIAATNYVNGLFTSITVCVPGTANCQTLDSVLVDTGSVGLRVLSSAAGGAMSLTLPQENDASGNPIVECSLFIDGFTWGPLQMADIKMGDEEARSVPIQVIGDPTFAAVPANCVSIGIVSQDTLQSLGVYGILGVGPFPQDCGGLCADPQMAESDQGANLYYACPPAGCQPAAIPVEEQAQNPVSLLPIDNNGVIVELPAVPASGAPSVTGTLLFGIGTQSNNGLGTATVLPIDPETLTFTTLYGGQSYPMSFIDSGSNAFYFLDQAAAGVSDCSANGQFSGFYCPTENVSLTATNQGIDGATRAVTFEVANPVTLAEANLALDDLAGSTCTGSCSAADSLYFDWGLPFFFGRNVFSSIEGAAAPGGQTPYFAY